MAIYGKTALVNPPLDLEKFKPIPKDRNRLPRIGVSGYTYGDGRKGERLVSQLYSNWNWNAVEWRASGRGWPMPTVNFAWGEMETFYQHIDIYLCASLIEGIPMPPLEALACGTPVVIPSGVGMLDDLPDGPGIWRYKAGDLDSMGKALRTALEGYGDVKQEWLRNAVSGYSIRRWVEDHAVLIDEIETPLEDTHDLPPYQGRAGVVYVAYGAPARGCVVEAMQSWKQYMPQIPIALISSEETGIEDIFIQYPDRDVGARWAKTVLDSLTPPSWDYVLYLDADTQITADISFLFQALQDGWDWIICRNPDKYHTTRRMIRPDNHDECEATFKIMGGDDFFAA